jgi:hypothetical protein
MMTLSSRKLWVGALTTSMTATLAVGSFLLSSAPSAPAADEADAYQPQVSVTPQLPENENEAAQTDETYDAEPEQAGESEAEPPSDSAVPAENSLKARKKSRKTAKSEASDEGAFRPDPMYDESYDTMEQVHIYGGKSAVEPPRPPLELGRQQYTSGEYDPSSTVLGELNPLMPGLAIYGDWRTAVAYNSNGGKDIAQVATRLNLDIDLKLTGTERIHAFFTPLQDNTNFTRFEFGGGDGDGLLTGEFDAEPQTLFFEGDFGSLYSGFSGKEATFDLPFAVGLFPLFLQNGIWANDAILGGAVTLPARNSATLGLSNFDVTFFGAFDNVDNASLVGENGKLDNNIANLFGATAFVDAFDGYLETGYGLIQGRDAEEDTLTHFVTAAYSRRYYNTLSNTTRVFANIGSDPDGDDDGFAIISENSLITSLPGTLIPYANFFVGFGNPQPLVDGNNAGILKNVGINFETDALTGYPKLDDTGSNAFGGAIGLQYLFNLDQQIVVEVAMVQPFEDDGIGASDTQIGIGARYQIPISHAWLFRADATYQFDLGDAEDNFGVRAEIRRKF